MKVGAVLPLTGALASIGEAMRQGIELAAQEAKNVRFETIFEDDKTGNKVTAVNAAKKLATVDKADVVFNAYASTAPVLSPILKQAEIPCLIIWDSNRALRRFGSHMVGFGYSNELAGEDMAEFSVKELKRKRAAVIALNDEWSEVVANAFEERFKALGGKVVLREQVDFDAADFKTLLAKIKAKKAESLYFPLFGAGLHSLLKQARSLNYEGDLLTADSFADYDLKETSEASEGLYLTQVWLDDDSFKKKFEARFGSAGSTGVNLGYVALGYDAVMLLDQLSAKILSSGQRPSAQAIIANVAGFSFNGVLGNTRISSDRTAERRESVLQVQNGKLRVVWKHP